jgi:hypothetical protein
VIKSLVTAQFLLVPFLAIVKLFWDGAKQIIIYYSHKRKIIPCDIDVLGGKNCLLPEQERLSYKFNFPVW